MLNYRKPAFWLILIAVVLCVAVAVCFLTNPIGLTLGKLWNLTDREYVSVTVIADSNARVLTQEAEIEQVLSFLDSAKVNSQPVSTNRIERASDYQIILSDGQRHIRVCFDVFLADVWMDDGEYSLPYFMKEPAQVKAFFEKIIGKTIPDVTPTDPSKYYEFDAVILQIRNDSILVQPWEGSAELASADRIWVRTSGLPEETVSALGYGHGVCIVYDGMIAETYPAQITTVYDIRPSVVEIEEEVTGWDSYAEWNNDTVGIKLRMYDDWEYDVIKNEADDAMGIQFRPEGEEGWIRFGYYPNGFGVCGTGLETVSGVTASGYFYEAGYYDGKPTWSFLVFQGMYRDFVVLNESEGWFTEYEAEIMEILDTAMLTVDK